MTSTIHHKLTVQPGGKIELIDPKLLSGQAVDVYIIVQDAPPKGAASALEILAKAPGQRVFHTAEEVDQYIHSERDAWDR